MSIDLPSVAREYFAAANAFDVDRTAALFAEDALVKDEGRDIRGREAIREWVERTMREYATTAAPERSEVLDGIVAVTALVSGRFPGSPLHLTFQFEIVRDRIAGLEIH